MNGMKAVNFYMLADRDRWTGCPLRNDGTIREKWYKMFLDLLSLLKDSELNTYSVLNAVNLVLTESSVAVIEKLFNA